jgi:hypothetical protein
MGVILARLVIVIYEGQELYLGAIWKTKPKELTMALVSSIIILE